jgi:succinyl-diaminopimelate desuccinylase
MNFGPGDPNLAHKPEEKVSMAQIRSVADTLRDWLAG